MSNRAEPRSRRSRPAKVPLSRALVIKVALDLLKGKEPDTVSLRDISTVLETGPASLYAYVENRDDLLLQAFDAVLQTVELPELHDVTDWKTGIAHSIYGAIDALSPYPGLSRVSFGTAPSLPGALRINEFQMALVIKAGLSEELAVLACNLFSSYVSSTSVHAPGKNRHSTHLPLRGRKETSQNLHELADSTGSKYPHAVKAANVLANTASSVRDTFAVTVMIEGISVLAAMPIPNIPMARGSE